MQAFHNDIEVKDKLIAHLKAHYDADEIIKGIYWGNGKGCAIGCAIHSDDHGLYEELFDIPVWIAMVQDIIFEGMPNDKAKKWPLLFTKTVKVGVDLNKIKIPFLMFIVESTLDKFDHKKFPKVKEYIVNIFSNLKNNINTSDNISCEDVDEHYRVAVSDSAYASGASYGELAAAASAYAASYVANVATDADNVAYDDSNVASAVYYAAHAGYATAENNKEKSYEIFADKLIELIENV